MSHSFLSMDNIFILIPAYNPDLNLNNLIDELQARGISKQNIVVVNDGSDNGYNFDELKVQVLSHSVNLGKGEALKNGFRYISNNYKNVMGIVTADCDMQHLPKDIVNIAEAMKNNPDSLIMGSRIFKGLHIPLRSKFGNNIISYFIYKLFKVKLKDTQTGLRGIPVCFLADLLNLHSSDFSFETEMLLKAIKLKMDIIEIPIETVYIERNKDSKFKPFKDSYKILKSLGRGRDEN